MNEKKGTAVITIRDVDEETGERLQFADGCGTPPGSIFTSVHLDGHNYGGAGGCVTPEEITNAIKSYKAWALREGDKVTVKDFRKSSSLFGFVKK